MTNRYKVPPRQWRKWSKRARFVFNALHQQMIDVPWAFRSPGFVGMSYNTWHVTAWNAAWVAADAVDEAP